METFTLHFTRGTLNEVATADARAMHNAFLFDGPQPGMEVARALGDLSHNVYEPALGMTGELLFADRWADPDGMETFFANPFAMQAAGRLFARREWSEWTSAPGAFGFQLPAPGGASARILSICRGPVHSVGDAAAMLAEAVRSNLGTARRRGQLGHAVLHRTAEAATTRPVSNSRHGDATPHAIAAAEILVLDSWTNVEGMLEHQRDLPLGKALAEVLSGPLDESVWQQADGFAEW